MLIISLDYVQRKAIDLIKEHGFKFEEKTTKEANHVKKKFWQTQTLQMI